jgi:hypothetical protein
VKQFLRSFNRGIKEKLSAESQEEVSYKIIEQMKKAAGINASPGGEGNEIGISDADFDF